MSAFEAVGRNLFLFGPDEKLASGEKEEKGGKGARLDLAAMKDWLIPITLATALSLGALYLFALSFAKPEGGTSPLPSTSPLKDSPALHTEPPADVAADRHPMILPAPPDVAKLRARCVEEARSGRGLTPGLSSACAAFSAASRAELPVTRTPPRSAGLPQPTIRPSTPARPDPNVEGGLRYVPIPVTDCGTRHRHGSIDYRKCRARVADYLRKACHDVTEQAAQASGDRRQHLRALARSYCRESSRYRITD